MRKPFFKGIPLFFYGKYYSTELLREYYIYITNPDANNPARSDHSGGAVVSQDLDSPPRFQTQAVTTPDLKLQPRY